MAASCLLVASSPQHFLHIFFFFLLLFLSHTPLYVSISDDEALIEFKELLKNTSVLDSSWKKGTNPCDNKNKWVGVQCENNVVLGLLLGRAGLSGDIDVDALVGIQGLRVLSLANNSFSGSIPDFFKLGALKSLYIDGNQFSGEIPEDFFFKMASLKKVWLSRNQFSGKIPDSLINLKYLIELRLENNEFSGPIPPLPQGNLSSINLSNNKLQGEIPQSLERFGPEPFQGNPELCGKQIGNECTFVDNQAVPYEDKPQVSATKWIILGVVVAFLLVTILFRAKRREDQFNILGKENLDEAVKVHIPSSNRRSMSSRSNGGGDSVHSSSRRGNRSMGDLVVVNDERGIFGLPDLMKASAEVLGNGGLGSAYKAVMGNGVSVVVKRLREMNKVTKDAFDIEIRRLGRLRHRNILPPLAYHYRKEEKLLVSEFISRGSLLYLLHGDRGISHAELTWPIRLKIIQGVASGMSFLHSEFASYEVPHGNLKSSNILLTSNYEPLLTDYAFFPLFNSSHAVQALFAYKSPEAILYQQVSPKSDVYCLGIIILEVLTGKFPSQYLNNQKSGTDVVQWVHSAIAENRESELIDPEIATATDSVEQMVKLLHVGATCTESEQDNRIDMREASRRIEDVHV